MSKRVAGGIASIMMVVSVAAAPELSRTLRSETFGFELRYPADWQEAEWDSDVISFHAGTPVPPVPPGSPGVRFVLAGPEENGFRPTLNVQPRSSYGAPDDRLRRELARSIASMAGRVPGASFEAVDDRLAALPGGPAVVVDYRFNDAKGRRLQSRQWLLAGENSYALCYTDTIERFEERAPMLDAIMASFSMFPPPPPMSYDEITNLWVGGALLLSALAALVAYLLYRRSRTVEEHPEGEPIVPESLVPPQPNSGGA